MMWTRPHLTADLFQCDIPCSLCSDSTAIFVSEIKIGEKLRTTQLQSVFFIESLQKPCPEGMISIWKIMTQNSRESKITDHAIIRG